MTIKHSIIIPTSGRPIAIRAAIESILCRSLDEYGAELIIVDNNVTEELSQDLENFCANWGSRLHYVRESSPGLSAARHRGAAEARGDWLTFLDDDIEVSTSWLSSLHVAFKNPEVVMVGGPSIPKFTGSIPPWFWNYFDSTPYGGWMNYWLSLLDIGKDIHNIDPNYIWGLNFHIRKNILYECGGFHPDLVPKWLQRWQGDGESGLAMKVKERGLRADYIQGALLHHLCGEDRLNIEYFQRRAFYQGVCNSFSEIRSGQQASITPFFLAILAFRRFRRFVGAIARALSKRGTFSVESENVTMLTNRAMLEGWKFHQNEVAHDKNLQKWVKRNNFFETNLNLISSEIEVRSTASPTSN
jgi:glycosyltransferase involved in cell wall biosynthesis